MDEQYWKGQVDAKLDFIAEELKLSKNTILVSAIKNDADHEIIKNEITSLKIKSSVWGMIAGGTTASLIFLGKHLWFR